MTWEFDEFYKWAERYLKLDLHAYKEKQLQRRINTVMARTGTTSLKSYSQLIQEDKNVHQSFLDYITINVTDFFRNEALFEEFESVLLEELVPKHRELKVWSAACSIGSEPYSLAMIMKTNSIRLQNKILATDIDEKILDRAREAVYKEYELKNLDKKLLDEFFTQKDEAYALDPVIKNMVQFKKHDLLLDPYEKNFHAIVCRNVMIYFKEDAKNIIYQKFSDSLVTGGVLFTGATESIFQPEKYGLEKVGAFIYQKI